MAVKITTKTAWHGSEVKVQGKKVVGKSIYEIGLVVEGQAKLLAPRDTGHLAASITTQAFSKGTELENPTKYATAEKNKMWKVDGSFRKINKPSNDLEVLVGTALTYAPYQEFGTVKMNSQPFLRPALDLSMGKVLTLLWDSAKYYFGDYLLRGNKR
jgi:HK97 gp10 family phage protein